MTIKEATAEANRRMGISEEEIAAADDYADIMAPGGGDSTIEPGTEEECIQTMMAFNAALQNDQKLRDALLQHLRNKQRRN
jgi:hypothetical protein